MSRHDRHSAILNIVMDEGSVHIDDIITRLSVSAATARRDLDHLADQQLVTRTRGGAIANPTSTEPPLRYRTSRMADEKTRIAKAAAAMVHPGDSIGLNGGTTTTEVAREIVLLPELTDPDVPVTLVTNAVNIASEMTVRQCVRVVVTGGIARARSFELTGPLAELILPSISVGTLFLGVEGSMSGAPTLSTTARPPSTPPWSRPPNASSSCATAPSSARPPSPSSAPPPRSTWSSPTTVPQPTRSRSCVGQEPRCGWSSLQQT